MGNRRRSERLGRWAEVRAILWYAVRGYRLLAWRYVTPVGEVDLILRRGEVLVFAEVKWRFRDADIAWAIDRKSQRRIARAGLAWLARHPPQAVLACRFDAVLLTGWHRIRVISNAWSVD